MNRKGESKVFCIGLPRTGTTSIHLAFQYLGFKSIHFPKELWYDIDHPITREFTAFSDTPLSLLYERLDEAFPNSLFILSTRDLEPWLKSCRWMYKYKFKDWAFDLEPAATFNKELFGVADFEQEAFTKAYHAFHEKVRSYFAGRPNLLELNLPRETAPWQKLCDFLGAETPSIPFPHHKDHENEFVNRVVNWLENRKYNNSNK